MSKKSVSKEEYRQVIDEILSCREVLTKTFDKYTANAIDRLIVARIKLETITIDRSKPTIEQIKTTGEKDHV